jgi:hypothetical protein
MAYDVGVRQFLQDKGVANNDIGYDQNSGNVTVKGQNFYKPELNMAGTTYSNRQNLDNAYGNYTKQQQPQDTTVGVGTGQGGSTAGNNGTPTSGTGQTNPYTNPYTQMIGDLIKHLSDTSNAPQQDIYSTPQYAAAKANQYRQSADAIRHASESAAGAGLGHSTIMTDRTQRIQGDSDQQLSTQLVPQIQAQLQQQRQQELQNQQNQLNNYFNLSNQADSQHNADRNFDAGRQDAATAATGYYNPSGMNADQINQEITKNSAAYLSANPEVQQQLHARNIYLNGLIGKTDSTGNGDYTGGNPNGNVGTRTVQGQQIDNQVSEVAYNHARDSLLDKRYEAKFNQDIAQQGFENALKIAVQQHQISNDNAQLAISQMNANTSAANSANSNANMQQDNLMNIWKATGKAPAGIHNVAEGTPYVQAPTSGQESKALQSTYVNNIEKMTPDKRAEFFKNEKSKIINDLDISGFNQLYSMYFDSNGYPKQ